LNTCRRQFTYLTERRQPFTLATA